MYVITMKNLSVLEIRVGFGVGVCGIFLYLIPIFSCMYVRLIKGELTGMDRSVFFYPPFILFGLEKCATC